MLLNFQSYYITPIQEIDAWALCNFMVANEDRFKLYMPKTLEQNLTPGLSKIFAAKKAKEYKLATELLFLVKLKESDALVGLVYLKNFDRNKREAEFAYCVGYQFKGKSVIAQAVKELCSYSFGELNLNSLVIITHKTNKASVTIAETNGFIWQKTLINEFTPVGSLPLDMELYKLNR